MAGHVHVDLIDPAGTETAAAVDVCVQPGDVVLGDARLLHAAHPNCSAERRTGITLWYIAGWWEVRRLSRLPTCVPVQCCGSTRTGMQRVRVCGGGGG